MSTRLTLPITVVVVDDHEVVRAGLSAALGAEPDMQIVGAAGDAAEAVQLVQRVRPAVVIVDFRLPDANGAQLCRILRRQPDPASVILLSTYLNKATVQSALDAGASAFVSKSAGMAELKREIIRVASNAVAPSTAQQAVSRMNRISSERQGPAGTTPQQLAVLKLAARGLTDRQIGTRLYVSESTIRFHIQNLKRRFDARNKVELIARAVQDGIIEDNDGNATIVRA